MHRSKTCNPLESSKSRRSVGFHFISLSRALYNAHNHIDITVLKLCKKKNGCFSSSIAQLRFAFTWLAELHANYNYYFLVCEHELKSELDILNRYIDQMKRAESIQSGKSEREEA